MFGGTGLGAGQGNWSTYTLMARYQLAMELLGQAEKIPGGDAMGFIYSWLRLSNMKLLDWYRNGNYQPKVCRTGRAC